MAAGPLALIRILRAAVIATHWDEDYFPFWQTLRAAHQEMKGQFTFIVAGVNPTCTERSHFQGNQINPIFQLAKPHYLESLSVDSVRDMVRAIGRYAGLQIEPDACLYLHTSYGGHPYLIRIACSELLQDLDVSDPQKRVTIHQGNFIDIRAGIQIRHAAPIRDILLSLVWWYPDDYDLLCVVAQGDM